MRLVQQFRTFSFLMVIAVHNVSACRAGFSPQGERSPNDQPVSPILLRSLEQEVREVISLHKDLHTRHWFAERLFRAQLQARLLDTLPEEFDELAGRDNFIDDPSLPNAIRKSRKAMALLGEGNLDAALGEISKLEYISQLSAIRNATAWCIETGRTEWLTPILEFDFDSRAPENEVWSTKAQIEETIRPLCLRDLALKDLMAGNRGQAAKLALDAVSQVLDFSGGAVYYGIVNDLDTYLDLAVRCGVMKEAWERIRPPLLEGTLATFSADSIALRLARSSLKDELEELLEACETSEKRNKCEAAAAFGFATAGDNVEAIRCGGKVMADITDQQLRALEPESFGYLVGAWSLAGKHDIGSALIEKRFVEVNEEDGQFIVALLERADVKRVLPLLEQGDVLHRHDCAIGLAVACKREKKDELARAWLKAKTDEFDQMNFDFTGNTLIVGHLASAWAVLGDFGEALSILQQIDLPDHSDPLTREKAAVFEPYRITAENMASFHEADSLVEWAMGLQHPTARAYAALGLFEGFAARNHRLEGWYPR